MSLPHSGHNELRATLHYTLPSSCHRCEGENEGKDGSPKEVEGKPYQKA